MVIYLVRARTRSLADLFHIFALSLVCFRYFHFLNCDAYTCKEVCQIDFPLFGKGLYSKGEDFASLGLGSKLFSFIVGPYTLHSTIVKVPVLGIYYSFLNTQHQTYVCSAVQDRPSTSPLYTVQSTTGQLPVLRILYSPLQINFQSSVYSTAYYRPSPPYYVQSTTDPALNFRILYSPLQTKFQSSVYSTIH